MIEAIQNLGHVFERAAQADPDTIALKKGDCTYTYQQLKQAVLKVKNYLLSLGLKRGNAFAVIGDNCPEWAISYLAIVRAGLVCVPLDRLLSEAEILHILRQSDAYGVIVSEKYIDKIDELKNELIDLKHIIPMNAIPVPKPDQDFPDVKVDPDGIAVLIFTSGTTGTSKAVMLSHNNILKNLTAIDQAIKVTKEDTLVSVIPMHHTFEATVGFLYPLFQGAAVYYPPSLKPKDIIATMREANVTCLIAVPLIFEKFLAGVHRRVSSSSVPTKMLFNAMSGLGSVFKFLRKPLFYRIRCDMGLGNLRLACAGGAALTEKVARGLELFAIPLIQGYGLTETAPVVAVNPLERPRNRSVGLPIPGVEVKINEPDSNGIGEILVKGSNVMLGYYKNPEATADVLINGWFYSGDLGYFDEAGYLYITGRKKSVIVTQSGKNVFPEELEEKLIKSQWIKEVLVVPRIDQKTKKEQICALVFPDYELLEEYSISIETTLTKEHIENLIHTEIKKVNEDLTAYKKITQFEIREDEFPKTTTLKIKRHMFLDRGMKV